MLKPMKRKQKSVVDELGACGFRVVGKAEVDKMPIEGNGKIMGHVVFHTVTVVTYDWKPIKPSELTPEARRTARKIGFRV